MDITDMVYTAIHWDEIIRGLQMGRATLVIDRGYLKLYDNAHVEICKMVASNNEDVRLNLIEKIKEINERSFRLNGERK